jgi:hypothetical protein
MFRGKSGRAGALEFLNKNVLGVRLEGVKEINMRHHSIQFPSFKLITRFLRAYFCWILICAAIPLAMPQCSAQTAEDSLSKAIDSADRFLRTEDRGIESLGYIHFGANYHGHEYLRTVSVIDGQGSPIPGQFALVYRFKWEGDGITDVAYLCDASGYVYKVQIMYTNAILSPPFVLANAAIKLLGNALIQANKDKMSEFERKAVQELVDKADAKGLLEWSLKFEQRFGK